MGIPFETDDGCGARARLGLVVLQSDETIENELSQLPASLDGVSIQHSRIPSGEDVTPESLQAMHQRLPDSVRLLPVGARYDAIGYGCTSGATIIGEQAVTDAVRSVLPGVAVTNPLTALKAACAAMKIGALGLITPYELSVTDAMAKNLKLHGIDVTSVSSFEQTSESVVARITPDSLLNALTHLATESPKASACDAWFVSCTNLRMARITATAEKSLAKPVLSSNQVLAWHMLRLAGVSDPVPGWGRLFETY